MPTNAPPKESQEVKTPTPMLTRRERVLALRAKIRPLSEEDANLIDKAITEAREASIPRDLSVQTRQKSCCC